jgi:DNA-directed RNA polymerase alpha subunit
MDEELYTLSTRTRNVLGQLQITTYEELKHLTLYDLLQTRNAGPMTARELTEFFWQKRGK